MEVYDLAMIIVLVAAVAYGAARGMAWQVASLGSILLSYFVAMRFRGVLAAHLGGEPPWNMFLAMLLLYLGTSLVIWLAFRVVADFIDRVKLKQFDRQMGAMLGAAKGVLLCTAITLFAVALWEGGRERILASQSGYYIALFLDRAHGVMPEEIHDVLHPYIHSLDETIDGGHAHSETDHDDHTWR